MDPIASASPSAGGSRTRLAATLVVAAVIVVMVFGGFAVGRALSRPAGPPVEVAGAVRVQPLSGWEVAGRFTDPPGVRLTRGAGNLDVVAVPFSGTSRELATWYVDRVLDRQARRLSVSPTVTSVRLASGLEGSRIAYFGLFGWSQAPIEGEVTAVVSPSGVGVIFNAWGPEGVIRYIRDDVRTMTDKAAVA